MLIERKLEQARRNLLELSTRNRLLNMPRRKTRVKTVEIVDKRSDDIFRTLVTEGRQMGFLPVSEERQEPLDQDALMTQPTGSDESRHVDNHLQSNLDSKQLQKRLLSIYYDARTSLEETGINILYLALGALKWFEAEEAVDERYAPLLLVPVELTRESAKERFKLKWSGEELSSNLSLSEKMRIEFGLDLPQMPDMDELIPSKYFSDIRERCAGMSRWEVLGDDLVLGFYSFAKLLMYHDLDPKAWPAEHALQKHQLIESLLVSGFSSETEPVCSEDRIDECVAVEHAIHIADADSSQTVAIEEVKAGRNLVIQGPPGTGKSQTITNLIAAAVARGQKVLFVAEKLAALEVVKRRLDERDLGSICLELHSRKANKKMFLDELRRTLEIGLPAQHVDEPVLQKLAAVRSALNEFCETLHKIQKPSGMTAYRITSELIRLYGRDKRIPDFELREAAGWTADEHRRNWEIVAELSARAKPIHPPSQHAWRGVQIETLLPGDKHRLNEDINQALELADNLCVSAKRLGATVGCTDCVTGRDILRVLMIANHITGAPSLDWSSMSDAAWIEQKADIEHAVATGEQYAALVEILQQHPRVLPMVEHEGAREKK